MPAEQMRVAQRRKCVLGLVARDELEERKTARARVEFLGQANGFEVAMSPAETETETLINVRREYTNEI